MSDQDPFEGTPFQKATVSDDETNNWSDEFELADNTVDLIGLFLDPDIRAARQKVHNQIENGAIAQNNQVNVGGVANQNMTPLAQRVSKLVVDLHAINKQAQRDQRNRR